MTPQVKKRIEQIRRGEVPEGYKKTKVGIVPEEWEETRFKNMFSRVTRKNKENNDNVLTISAQYGLISQRNFFNKDIASDDKSNYYLLENGEFAYNKSYSNGYPYGALKRLELYDKGVVSPLYICFAATEENKCPDFYVHYFEAGKMDREIKAFAQEGARNHGLLNISVEDFFNSYLLNPPLSEQEKIAEILSAQDKLLETQQKKIDELKRFKKACLSKMFPKKGCDVPEVRFPGFTDPWEQREFKNITFPSGVKNKENLPYESYSVTNENGFIPQNEQFENGGTMATADKTMYYIVTQNSFAYNPARINVGSIGYYQGTENVIVSSLYEVFQTTDEIDDRFLWHWFKSEKFQRMIEQYQEGGVRLYFYYDKLCMCSISAPNIEEQRRIGAYFDNLDNLITLHQRELEEEQKKKKALMQLLLTGIVRTV